nr:putative retrotransposon Gag domain, aspartic peptidase domain protein [Tanacetum cinerariifolium]
RQVHDKWYQEPGRFEAMANETEKNGASGNVVDENRGRDDARQHPKKRGTSKDVVTILDKRVAGVETSMAELKNQVEGLEGLGSDFESMREDFRREARAVDDFLWEMEQYLEGVNVVDDASKIKMATRYLKDTAALWWRRRHGDIERVNNSGVATSLLGSFSDRGCTGSKDKSAAIEAHVRTLEGVHGGGGCNRLGRCDYVVFGSGRGGGEVAGVLAGNGLEDVQELGQAQRPKTSASWEAPHAYA